MKLNKSTHILMQRLPIIKTLKPNNLINDNKYFQQFLINRNTLYFR